jgi:hypothetical protein
MSSCIYATGNNVTGLSGEERFYLKSPSRIDIWIGSPDGCHIVQREIPAREAPAASGNIGNKVYPGHLGFTIPTLR